MLDFEGKKARRQRGQLKTRCFQATSPRVVTEHAGLVGSLAGSPSADRALAQFLLGPVVGLLLNVDLDQLPGHLIAQRTGNSLQLRELGASRKAIRVKFLREFPSHPAQTRVKFRPNLGGILAHFRGPLQGEGEDDCKRQTSIRTIPSVPLAGQTMSCARRKTGGAQLGARVGLAQPKLGSGRGASVPLWASSWDAQSKWSASSRPRC